MRKLLRKHVRRITPGHGIIIAIFLLSGALALDSESSPALIFKTAHDDQLTIGESDLLMLHLNTPTAVNAVGAIITYPPELLDIRLIDTSDSFVDLWVQEPLLKADSGEVHLSGGTLQKDGLSGDGMLLVLDVEAKKTGDAEITIKNSEVIAHDGAGTVLKHEVTPFTYHITAQATGGGGGSGAPAASLPTRDLNADGTVNIVDVSILLVRLFGQYDARYDLDADGALGLSDLSILLANAQ